ncbi:MAG: PAS domain S-box protein [Deltaproteobacteria bacterium]|nr:PAS domain S-box protein [Deltaproteobacteria bacterium]
MHPLVLLHFFVLIACAEQAAYALYKNPSHPLNRSLFGASVCFCLWSLQMMVLHAPHVSKDTAWFFVNLGSLGWILFAPCFLWFVLTFTEKSPLSYPASNAGLLLVSLVLMWRQIGHGDIVVDLVPASYGHAYVLGNNFWCWMYHAYYGGVALACVIMLLSFSWKTEDRQRKKMARLLVAVTLAALLFVGTLNSLLPALGVIRVPALGNVAALFWMAVLMFAMVRYRFTLSPATAADNILATMNDALILFDLHGRVVEANHSAIALTGRSRMDLLNCTVEELFSGEPGGKEVFRRVLAGDLLRSHESEIVTSAGVKVPILVSASRLMEGGRVAGVVCAARDVTHLKRAQKDLEERERLRNSILQSVSDGIFTLDENFHYLLFNRAMEDITGLERGRAVNSGKTPWELFPALAGQGARNLFLRAMSGEKVQNEASYPHRGRDTRRTLETYLPLWSAGGRITGIVGVVRDVTRELELEKERRKLENMLSTAQRLEAIGTLAGGTAHNFNNLLMGISGNTTLARLSLDENHPAQEKLEKVEKLVASGSALTAQLLGYASQGSYGKAPCSLNELVTETASTFLESVANVRLEMDLEPDLSPVLADAGQMEQVLLNLYVNAVEAMPDGGTLTIRTENTDHTPMAGRHYDAKPGAYVRLSVTDTGVGMDSEALERIFEPFFTTKGMSHGTGLGLASAYGIVKGHGGYIHADSTVGKGSCFEIFLPVAAPQAEAPPRPALRGPRKILVVDDDRTILDATGSMLRKMGFSFLAAENAAEALEILAAHPDADLILLDLILPDMAAADAFAAIKRHNPSVRVVLTSGWSLDHRSRQLLDSGCDGFLQKPFTMAALEEKIRQALRAN